MSTYLPTIRQLQYLVALHEHGHFGRAADASFVSQSTLSAGIRELESLLGVTLVERFTRVDVDTLEYEYTVTDPETWTSPWTVSIPLRRTDVPMYEYACHEGNYAMDSRLSGARVQERGLQER